MPAARHRRRAASPPGKLPRHLERALDLAAFDPRVHTLSQLQAAIVALAPDDAAARPLDSAAICTDRAARVRLLAWRVRRALAMFHPADVVHFAEVPKAGQRRKRRKAARDVRG